MKKLALVGFVIIQAGFACEEKVYEVKATDKGFEPSLIKSEAGVETIVQVTRTSDLSCASKVHVPSTKLSYELPLNKAVRVNLGHLKDGKINFECPIAPAQISTISVR